MKTNHIKPICTIKTPYKTIAQCPRNICADGAICHLLIEQEYAEASIDLTVDQPIIILYWLGGQLDTAQEYLVSNDEKNWRSVFSTRSPVRPNPIGVAVLEVDYIDGTKIVVTGLDCLDGTQLLDIKPAIHKELHQKA